MTDGQPADRIEHGGSLELKNQLRLAMIRRRETLTADQCAQAAANLRRPALELLARLGYAGQPLNIGVYAAIRQELDLARLWPDLLSWPAGLYFPAVSGRGADARLVFARLPAGCRPGQFLVPGRFGIAEPPQSAWLAEPPSLDVIFLPGLAFDRQGNRLGWGRAFYDRFLPTVPNRPVLVGVGYGFQILPEPLPAEPNDYPVDWLLTPDGFQRIGR